MAKFSKPLHQQRNKEKASAAGGKARADKNQIVKNKAAELLKEKGPELIGLSEREQAEFVARALWDFIVAYNEETKKINQKLKANEQIRRNIALNEDALPDTLLKWWKNTRTKRCFGWRCREKKLAH